MLDNQFVLIVGLYIVFGLFEIPFFAEGEQKPENRLRNFFYGAILFISGLIFANFLNYLIPFSPRILPEHGIIFSIFILLVYLFLTDFIFYWYHRAEHRFSFMWVIHELHHSDTNLNVTTGMRSYWLERPIQTLLIALPIQFIIGIDQVAVLLLPFVLTFWLLFTHANLKLRMGFLTPVLVGPQLHRIHHSTLPQHMNKNMAQFFPVIDILFGTYYAPAYDEFPGTGTSGLAVDAPMLKVIKRPFTMWFRQLFKKKSNLELHELPKEKAD